MLKKTALLYCVMIGVSVCYAGQGHNEHAHRYHEDYHHTDDHDHGDEDAQTFGAHTHGAAHLDIALEDETLTLAFATPAMNIVGFEHAPRNDEQQSALQQAKQQLSVLTNSVTLSGGDCRSVSVEVEMDSLHAAHDDEEDTHSDVSAEFSWHCRQAETLQYMDIELFKTFAGIEKIHAQVVTADKQFGQVLTSTERRITMH